MKISIIVPIYHGKRYIKSLVSQAEINAKNISYKIELLLVNDDPSEQIDEICNSEFIQIRVINTDKNRGIHGARVRGLKRATGDFVLFLDQDDRITPDYIKKQLVAIGDADAVVCEAIQDGKEFYHQGQTIQECITKNYILQKGNFIISPGQVLLREASIPAFWKENILAANGADDWFLWICMLCTKKRFVCNQEILFEHVIHTNNTSANGTSMLKSMREVYEKSKRNMYCTKQDLRKIASVIQRYEGNYLEERDKFLELYFMMDSWMALREQGKSIADHIRNCGCDRVSIYGKGRIGLRLARELQPKIMINCFIDQSATVLTEGIRTILPEKVNSTLEPIIITLAKNEAIKVKHIFMDKGIRRVYILSDIIEYLKGI